jgi:septal ring factor EnvC (AmiA/AmiB activator)
MLNAEYGTDKSLYSALLAFTVCCVLLAGLILPDFVAAETPKEQYHRIQKEMERRREKLEQAKRREHSVLGDLDRLGRSLDSIAEDMRKQQRHVRETESEIAKVENEISVLKGEMEKEKAWLRRRLRVMQRYGQSGDLLFLLTATDDLAQLERRWKYLEVIAMTDRKVIEKFVENIKSLDRKEKRLTSLRSELKMSMDRIKPVEASLEKTKREKEVLLASVRREKTTQQMMLKELREASKRLLDMMRRLEEKETFEAKGFSALKGSLMWPVRGRVVIPYGSQRDPRFNTPVFRNGIYIKADNDTVSAVYAGKVVYADWFKGYGNLVIINHGEGYHTLYGNLAETFLKVGDIIKRHEIIGKVGESGIVNAPSLYFEVRYRGKPLDPMQWLRRK